MSEEAFRAAAERVKTLAKAPSNDVLLQLYALFKQGTDGDASGDRPGRLQMVKRAKYDAHQKLAGMSKADAQKKYVALVDSLM